MTNFRVYLDLKKNTYRALSEHVTPEKSISKLIREAVVEWLERRGKG